jgi:RNA polymerase sigma-70 factor (ECF subfamily)
MLHLAEDPDGPAREEGPPVLDHADEVAGTHDAAAALALVPEEFRVALVLADVQDMAYEEIAKVLDVPIGTVKSRVHRGRLALARAMGLDAREPGPLARPSEGTV